MGGNPYAGIPVTNILDDLKDGLTMCQPQYCPDELYAIMSKCWNNVATKRPTFEIIKSDLDVIYASKVCG